MTNDDAYPKELKDIETKLIGVRRCAVNGNEGKTPYVGLALSGGGVRSATFALGVLQALAAKRCLDKIDFLSTVSGGGYIGSFLSRFFSRAHADANAVQAALDPAQPSASMRSGFIGDVLGWLRENGRYLAPTGSGDLLTGAAVMLRNWVAVQVVLICAFVMLLLIPQLPRQIFFGIDLPDLAHTMLWWSPYNVLIPILIACWVVPAGWAYWLTPPHVTVAPGHRHLHTRFAARIGFVFVGIVAIVAYCLAPADAAWVRNGALTALVVVAITVVFAFGAFVASHTRANDGAAAEADPKRADDEKSLSDASQREFIRRTLSDWLKVALVTLLAVAVFVLVDSFGQTLYAIAIDGQLSVPKWLGGLIGALTAVAAGARRVVVAIAPLNTMRQGSATIVKLLGTAAALGIYFVLLSAMDALAHGLVWNFGPPPTAAASLGMPLVSGFAALVLLNMFIGRAWTFINDSTIQPLYRSRLARAYLGATNPRRVPPPGSTDDYLRVIAVARDDDITLRKLWWNTTRNVANDVAEPPDEPTALRHGAPLHLINVTINETLDGRTGIQNNDRRGFGMAIGPAGLSAGIRHHIVISKAGWACFPLRGFSVFNYAATELGGADPPFEPLTLAQWTGLSGAAFSTGLGARTSLGLSLLAGFFNIRLGYWWDSGVDPVTRFEPGRWRRFVARLLPRSQRDYRNAVKGSLQKSWWGRIFAWTLALQSYLFDEFVARFHGTGRRWWYISDGGHFENMGAYELIRRRVPLIFIVDAEADADYRFEGLSNLVRKARLDFNADIRFVDDAAALLGELGHRKYFGSLDMLRPGSKTDSASPRDDAKKSACHAALAQVCYDGATTPASWIIYIKPTLSGDEPADVTQYHSDNPEFPQQPTSDQFFDEAQWESYRRLGEHVGAKVFSEGLAPYMRLAPLE